MAIRSGGVGGKQRQRRSPQRRDGVYAKIRVFSITLSLLNKSRYLTGKMHTSLTREK
jgi:hypothetical protein